MQSKRKNKGSDIRTRFASKAKEIEEIGSALQKSSINNSTEITNSIKFFYYFSFKSKLKIKKS